MQEKVLINGIEVWQPDKDMQWDFETTYTQDSVRVQTGKGHWTPMFTVESFSYSATNVPKDKVAEILQNIIGKNFLLYCYSPYYGEWREDEFQVGKGSLSIGTLKTNEEVFESISFNMVGVNPLVEH